jgi:hypothetical protein
MTSVILIIFLFFNYINVHSLTIIRRNMYVSLIFIYFFSFVFFPFHFNSKNENKRPKKQIRISFIRKKSFVSFNYCCFRFVFQFILMQIVNLIFHFKFVLRFSRRLTFSEKKWKQSHGVHFLNELTKASISSEIYFIFISFWLYFLFLFFFFAQMK